jgi:dolichol-phosphate mannosyltransferase
MNERALRDADSEEEFVIRLSVAVLLPTYCEAGSIETLIRELEELKLNLLVAVVDDSSPDATAEVVERLQKEYHNILLLTRPSKLGLGTAITMGFRSLLSLKHPPKFIVTMDADYSHDPHDVPRLVHVAEHGCDLVVGSRYCEGGRITGWHRIRWLISRLANLIASAALRTRLHDCTSGFRCYSRDYVKTVLPDLHSQTYEIQIETVKQAWLRGFCVKEIPITFENRKQGKSKLTKAELQGFLFYILKSKIADLGHRATGGASRD